MPQTQQKWFSDGQEASWTQSLKQLNKLYKAEEKTGLSSGFKEKVAEMENSLSQCDQAMKILSSKYLSLMGAFKEERDAIQALEQLNEAEKIWKEQTKIILKLDPEGREKDFLKKIRSFQADIIYDKIDEMTRPCKKELLKERLAFCLAAVGLLDAIFAEEGKNTDSPERKRLALIAKNLALC